MGNKNYYVDISGCDIRSLIDALNIYHSGSVKVFQIDSIKCINNDYKVTYRYMFGDRPPCEMVTSINTGIGDKKNLVKIIDNIVKLNNRNSTLDGLLYAVK